MPKLAHHDLLYSVGRALHEWSLVEMELARCFSSLVGSNSHDIFGTVISFETRVALADTAAAKSDLSAVEKLMWAKLSARLSKLYKKRHELAHFTLGWDAKKNEVLFPFLTTANWLEENRPALQAHQVKERSDKFGAMFHALRWFGEIAIRRRMPLQAPHMPPLEEPPLVAQLRELASQNPAA